MTGQLMEKVFSIGTHVKTINKYLKLTFNPKHPFFIKRSKSFIWMFLMNGIQSLWYSEFSKETFLFSRSSFYKGKQDLKNLKHKQSNLKATSFWILMRFQQTFVTVSYFLLLVCGPAVPPLPGSQSEMQNLRPCRPKESEFAFNPVTWWFVCTLTFE